MQKERGEMENQCRSFRNDNQNPPIQQSICISNNNHAISRKSYASVIIDFRQPRPTFQPALAQEIPYRQTRHLFVPNLPAWFDTVTDFQLVDNRFHSAEIVAPDYHFFSLIDSASGINGRWLLGSYVGNKWPIRISTFKYLRYLLYFSFIFEQAVNTAIHTYLLVTYRIQN